MQRTAHEAIASPPGPSASTAASNALPSGPRSLAEATTWPAFLLERVVTAGHAAQLTKNLEMGVNLFIDYSGMGSVEQGCTMWMEAWAAIMGKEAVDSLAGLARVTEGCTSISRRTKLRLGAPTGK